MHSLANSTLHRVHSMCCMLRAFWEALFCSSAASQLIQLSIWVQHGHHELWLSIL